MNSHDARQRFYAAHGNAHAITDSSSTDAGTAVSASAGDAGNLSAYARAWRGIPGRREFTRASVSDTDRDADARCANYRCADGCAANGRSDSGATPSSANSAIERTTRSIGNEVDHGKTHRRFAQRNGLASIRFTEEACLSYAR